MSTSKIDILSINETTLDITIDDSELYLPGFEIIRKDRKIKGVTEVKFASMCDLI